MRVEEFEWLQALLSAGGVILNGLVDFWSIASQMSLYGLWGFSVITVVFAFYVCLVCWGFYLLTGYTFVRANKYAWRWAKRKLDKLDRDWKYRFTVRGFRLITYYRARELAIVLWAVCVIALMMPKDGLSWTDWTLLAVGVGIIIVANSLQGLQGRSRGTHWGFVKIYYRPAAFLVGPSFGVGKLFELWSRSGGDAKLIASYPF